MNLSNPDIEVLLNIVNGSVVIGIALTKESRGKRNITHFGPTTLKSSIAYCMLQLANIQPGREKVVEVKSQIKLQVQQNNLKGPCHGCPVQYFQ